MGGTQNSSALPPLSKGERAVIRFASRLPPREAMEAHSSAADRAAERAAERAAALTMDNRPANQGRKINGLPLDKEVNEVSVLPIRDVT